MVRRLLGFTRRISHTKSLSHRARLGDSEAVFQHLKAHNFTIGDGKHDCKVRLGNLAGSLELGRERAKYHCSIVAGQNVVDLDPMSGSPHPKQTGSRQRSRGMAGQTQQTSRQGRLAIHNRGRPRETEEAVPAV